MQDSQKLVRLSGTFNIKIANIEKSPIKKLPIHLLEISFYSSLVEIIENYFSSGEHGVVVRAFGLYWGGIRFQSLSTHHCWSLSNSFITSLVVWLLTKNNAFGGEKQNGEQSDLCDLEQVTLKPQLQVHHYLTTWLQIWYHILLCGDSIRKGADFEKQNCLFGLHPAVMGKLSSPSLSSLISFLGTNSFSTFVMIDQHDTPHASTSCNAIVGTSKITNEKKTYIATFNKKRPSLFEAEGRTDTCATFNLMS